MKKLLVIVNRYPPASGSGMFRNFKFSKYLIEFGWLPSILTLHERYSDKIDIKFMNQIPFDIKIFRVSKYGIIDNFYNLLKTLRESINKVTIFSRAKNSGNNAEKADQSSAPYQKTNISSKLLRFIMSLMRFPDKSAGWIVPGFFKARRIIRENGINLIYSSSPPISSHVIGLLLKKSTKLPWVIDIRDPLTNEFHIKNSPLRKGYIWLEKVIFKNADGIIFNTENMRFMYERKISSIVNKKITVIINGVDTEDFNKYDSISSFAGENSKLHILHAGDLYDPGRLPDTLLQATAELLSEGKINASDMDMKFIGGEEYKYFSSYEQIFSKNKLHRIVRFTPHLPHLEIVRNLATADILLLLQTHEMYATQIPAKMFEYIITGKPILAIVKDGATKQFLEQANLKNCWILPPEVSKIKKSLLMILNLKKHAQLLANKPDQKILEKISRRNLTRELSYFLNRFC